MSALPPIYCWHTRKDLACCNIDRRMPPPIFLLQGIGNPFDVNNFEAFKNIASRRLAQRRGYQQPRVAVFRRGIFMSKVINRYGSPLVLLRAKKGSVHRCAR